MELTLGTAQFGLNYGINEHLVPTNEVRQIITRAWELGIRTLDTATVYGDIEERLPDLIGAMPYTITSKIPIIPKELENNAIEPFITKSIERIRQNLGAQVNTILFHEAEDLLQPQGQIMWDAATRILSNTPIRLGVSCYSPEELSTLQQQFTLQVAQLPGNAFDQRINAFNSLYPIELQLRSVFLQGALLQTSEIMCKKMPWAFPQINYWHNWCKQQGLTPLQASLSLVKSYTTIQYCVIGVDSLRQLEDIVSTWEKSPLIEAPELQVSDLDIIDPRRWNRKRHFVECVK